MKNKNLIVVKSLVLAIVVMFSMTSITKAESAADKMEDAKTSTKKNVRKAKRKVRKATGTDTVGKDIKDGANDMSDEVKGAKNKATN